MPLAVCRGGRILSINKIEGNPFSLKNGHEKDQQRSRMHQ